MSRNTKVYTCTPRDFPGNSGFYNRDSGLFCRGLNAIGVDSKAIVIGGRREDDLDELIRATMEQMENPEWWRALDLDGLIFYSWAAPDFNGIARALRDADVPFLVVMDTCGMISLASSPRDWCHEGYIRSFAKVKHFWQYFPRAAKWLYNTISGHSAKRRLPHYDAATRVAAVTPLGSLWIPNEAVAAGRDDLVQKFCYLPHPQDTLFHYDGTAKENLVISVGRWGRGDWPQKNPKVLLNALIRFLKHRTDWRGLIVGACAEDLPEALGMPELMLHPQLHFRNALPQEELVNLYRKAKIGFWSSRWEGQQGTGAQALCCGTSIVGPFSASMSCFRHYVSRASGRLAGWNTPEALANELILESEAWDLGHRDPHSIGQAWCQEFHAPEVAKRAIELLCIDRQDA